MKPLVLIVEDEAPLVTCCATTSKRKGSTVGEAGDGEEALIRIAERRPDVVLLDWMLPLVSGIEVCRQIRRSPQTRALPIIMLTARGEEGDRVRGLDSGADDYIVKPFSPSELVARLRAVIRRAQPNAARGDAAAMPTWRWISPRTACRGPASRSISARPSSACCAI